MSQDRRSYRNINIIEIIFPNLKYVFPFHDCRNLISLLNHSLRVLNTASKLADYKWKLESLI